jgi:NADH-quinone oxidoreductase subunit E
MAVRRLAEQQPASFAFTPENISWAEAQMAKYPEGRQASAVIPLLWKAQEQHGGWLPEPAIRVVAEMLGMAYIRVLEVATFYTMFNLEPVGAHFIQLCGTTPCMLRGANALKDVCRKVIGPEKTLSADGAMSWMEVECLGACSNAPMVQINYDYYEDLTPESLEALLGDLKAGRPVKTGSQTGRAASCPAGGPTSLTDASLYDGSVVGAWKKRFEETAMPAQANAPTEAAKPKQSGAGEKLASDSPGVRAAAGQTPIKPQDQAAAARTTSASDAGGSPDPAPQSAGSATSGETPVRKPRVPRAKTSASAPGDGLKSAEGQDDDMKSTSAGTAPGSE